MVVKQWWGTGEPAAFGIEHNTRDLYAHMTTLTVVTIVTCMQLSTDRQAVHADVHAEEHRNARQDIGT